MKKRIEKYDVQECNEKLLSLLREFNCGIEIDDDLKSLIIFDKDNNRFEHLHVNK